MNEHLSAIRLNERATVLIIDDDETYLRRISADLQNCESIHLQEQECDVPPLNFRASEGWMHALEMAVQPHVLVVGALKLSNSDSSAVGSSIGLSIARATQHFRPVACVGLGTGTLRERIEVIERGGHNSLHRNCSARELWEAIQLALAASLRAKRLVSRAVQRRGAQVVGILNDKTTSISEEMFSLPRLSQRAPEEFRSWVDRYTALVHLSLDMRILKSTHDLSSQLTSLASELAMEMASGKDVLEIHREVSGMFAKEFDSPIKRRALDDESRLIWIGLLGKLLSNYRTSSVRGGAS